MDVTRLAGVALASAMIFACSGRVAPEDAAANPDPREEMRPPAAVQEAHPDEGEDPRG